MSRLFILFNHSLNTEQKEQAMAVYGVSAFVPPPPEVAALWRQLPAQAERLAPLLQPVRDWLDAQAQPGDPLLVQGDFGACFLIVAHALNLGMIPVYATTERHAVQQPQDDGSIRMVHFFRHVRFRRYGA